MRLLLDTHIYLWVVNGDRHLSASARQQISAAQEVYVSAASIWEIAIKIRIGKLEADIDTLVGAIDASGFAPLSVSVRHSAAVAELPLHHADPFDRLLLAQAFSEPLQLLTADRQLAPYGGGIRFV